MIEVKSLIARLRRTLKDEDENSFTDAELLDYISDAITFVRRLIVSTNPEFISVPIAKGTLEKGENEVILPSSVELIVDMRIDGVKIRRDNINAVKNTEETGKINRYCLLNRRKVLFFPVPEEPSRYDIVGIKQFYDLSLNDTTPYGNDIDPLIFEYVVIRAGMGDMFQMSQELSVMANIVEQVNTLVRNTNDSEDNFVEGY